MGARFVYLSANFSPGLINTLEDRELGSPSALAGGGKATRADLSAFNINAFHDVDHLCKP
jgi:hypothetical protein